MIKAVIFDCFGVLVGQGFDETYRKAGGDPVADQDFIDDMLGAANLGLMTSDEMRHKMAQQLGISYREWAEILMQSEQPKPEVFAYIGDLKDRGYKVAVLSNANIGTLPRKMSQEQLAVFDELIVSAEVGVIKPDAKIYEVAVERLGLTPQECIFTDDNKDYCDAAEAAGIKAVQYRDFEQAKRELEALLTDTNH